MAGKAGLGTFAASLFLLFGITHALQFVAAFWLGGVAAVVGFVAGFFYEKNRRGPNVGSYIPGSAYNPHPDGSALWYQHEQLMIAEREEAARRADRRD